MAELDLYPRSLRSFVDIDPIMIPSLPSIPFMFFFYYVLSLFTVGFLNIKSPMFSLASMFVLDPVLYHQLRCVVSPLTNCLT